MRSIPRFKIPDDADTHGDITYKDGKFYIKGQTLKNVKRMAKKAGVSPAVYLNQLLREAMGDPDWLDNIVREEARECRRFGSSVFYQQP